MPRVTVRQLLRSAGRCTIGLGTACVVFGLGAPAFADPVRGLPEGWLMSDDATYAPADKRWAYRAPATRRGTYAHGASGELETAPGIDAQAAAMACYRRTGSFPDTDVQGEEYWYFEAGGEALLLLKSNLLKGYDADCRAMIGATFTVERAVIGRDGFTRFVETATGWHGETRQFTEYRSARIDDIFVGNARPALARFVVRKRRLSDSDRGGRIGKVETHCIAYSSPPDAGGGQCWAAGSGPGKGIVTSDYEILMGSPYIYQSVSDLEDGVALDGRLFEWDRPIRNSGAGAQGTEPATPMKGQQ
ncbi:MAG: hypothetical protein WC729_22520 [Sphingomonas sp.]|jgi:hypothetical protein